MSRGGHCLPEPPSTAPGWGRGEQSAAAGQKALPSAPWICSFASKRAFFFQHASSTRPLLTPELRDHGAGGEHVPQAPCHHIHPPIKSCRGHIVNQPPPFLLGLLRFAGRQGRWSPERQERLLAVACGLSAPEGREVGPARHTTTAFCFQTTPVTSRGGKKRGSCLSFCLVLPPPSSI